MQTKRDNEEDIILKFTGVEELLLVQSEKSKIEKNLVRENRKQTTHLIYNKDIYRTMNAELLYHKKFAKIFR